MDEVEFTESELLLLEEPIEFKRFLYSLHDEIDITDVDEVIVFYKDLGWEEHVDILIDFKDIIDG